MKIPKFIQEHIEKNNRLLAQANKHAVVVQDWYINQLKKLDADESELADEEFYDIQTNCMGNGEIFLTSIQENLKLLEDEQKERED